MFTFNFRTVYFFGGSIFAIAFLLGLTGKITLFRDVPAFVAACFGMVFLSMLTWVVDLNISHQQEHAKQFDSLYNANDDKSYLNWRYTSLWTYVLISGIFFFFYLILATLAP